MIPNAIPNLSNPMADHEVDEILESQSTAPHQLPEPDRLRKVRELVSPQMNGDQDVW